MHRTQSMLLQLITEQGPFEGVPLRRLGELIGGVSPQAVKHHLDQLVKRGLIRVDRHSRRIERTRPNPSATSLRAGQLLTIPILGTANAGPAELFAEENLEGYLRVSSRLAGRTSGDHLFAIRVSGPSMNRATLHGKAIEDGDYVVIDSADRVPHDGDLVLSVIDGMANIKHYHFDQENNQIVLLSDSTRDVPPIYIHPDDDYEINGKVVQVIKTPIR